MYSEKNFIHTRKVEKNPVRDNKEVVTEHKYVTKHYDSCHTLGRSTRKSFYQKERDKYFR